MVTNRWLALPIFAVVMFIVYYVSVTTVGTWATDWANDGLFGDGWHLFGIGSAAYEESVGEWETEQLKIDAFVTAAEEQGIDTASFKETMEAEEPNQAVIDAFLEETENVTAVAEVENDEGVVEETIPVAVTDFRNALEVAEPDPADFGVWVPGIPVLIEKALEAGGNCLDSRWL